jgi:acetolactate synthase small subunit
MLIQVKLQPITNASIVVPWATGIQELDAEADPWLYRIPDPKNHIFSEFVITPFNISVWQDLWSVQLINVEQTGILTRLARFMRERKINIVSVNSSTIDQGAYHASRLVIDCTQYSYGVDRDHQYRSGEPAATLSQLQRELTLEFIEEVRLFNSNHPSIAIVRNLSMWRLYQEVKGAEIQAEGTRLRIENGKVTLPDEELRRLKHQLARVRGNEPPGDPWALTSVDDYSDAIRIFPFFQNMAIVPLAVTVDNRPGAIAAVAHVLSTNQVNVLASKGWTSADQQWSHVWMLLRDESQESLPVPDEQVETRVKDLFLTSGELRAYDIKVYPVVLEVHRGEAK